MVFEARLECQVANPLACVLIFYLVQNRYIDASNTDADSDAIGGISISLNEVPNDEFLTSKLMQLSSSLQPLSRNEIKSRLQYLPTTLAGKAVATISASAYMHTNQLLLINGLGAKL